MYSGRIRLSKKESDRAKRNLIFSPNAGEKKTDWECKHIAEHIATSPGQNEFCGKLDKPADCCMDSAGLSP